MQLVDDIRKLPLKERVIDYNDVKVKIMYMDNIDSIVNNMTEIDFGEDERFPYYLNIWESGTVLPSYFAGLETSAPFLNGKCVLELGAGTGVAGISLARFGAKVIFSDYEETSLELIKLNAEINDIRNYELLLADWRKFPDIHQNVDIVIASDVLYEKRHVIPLYSVFKKFIDKIDGFFISDPGRGYIDSFIGLARDDRMNVELVFEQPNKLSDLCSVKVYKITK